MRRRGLFAGIAGVFTYGAAQARVTEEQMANALYEGWKHVGGFGAPSWTTAPADEQVRVRRSARFMLELLEKEGTR